MLIVILFPIPQYLTTNVGNHSMGVRDDDVCVCETTLNLGDNGVCVRNIASDL